MLGIGSKPLTTVKKRAYGQHTKGSMLNTVPSTGRSASVLRGEKVGIPERFVEESIQYARGLFEQPRLGALNVGKEKPENHLV